MSLNTDSAAGAVTLSDGRRFSFSVPVVTHQEMVLLAGLPASQEVGLFRDEETFNQQQYLAGWIILPGQRRGGIIHVQSKALLTVPFPAESAAPLAGQQVQAPNLGTFTLQPAVVEG